MISLVSVEHVGLFTMHFTLIGLIFARMNERPATDSRSKSKSASRRRQKHISFGLLPWLVAGLTLVGFVVASIQVSRPLPWEPIYSLQLAEIKVESGDIAGAAPYAIKAARTSRYQGSIIASAASVVFDSGDTEGGRDMMRKAVANDPYAPALKKNLAILIEAEGLDALKDAVGL